MCPVNETASYTGSSEYYFISDGHAWDLNWACPATPFSRF
jgi:hypothetical protein